MFDGFDVEVEKIDPDEIKKAKDGLSQTKLF
jgi:hypothetical protein